MGMAAALKLQPVIANVQKHSGHRTALRLPGAGFPRAARSGKLAEQAREMVRKVSPHIAKDRPLHADIARVAGLISEGALAGLIAPDSQI